MCGEGDSRNEGRKRYKDKEKDSKDNRSDRKSGKMVEDIENKCVKRMSKFVNRGSGYEEFLIKSIGARKSVRSFPRITQGKRKRLWKISCLCEISV
jgi:hypothetical protein